MCMYVCMYACVCVITQVMSSGSGCTDGCTTEFVFVGTEAPVVGADRSDARAVKAAGRGQTHGPSLPLLTAALTLTLLALHRQWR